MPKKQRHTQQDHAQLRLVDEDKLAEPVATTLADFRELLISAGAPDDVLQMLDNASSIQQAMERVVGTGFLPSDPIEPVLEHFKPLTNSRVDHFQAELAGAELLVLMRHAADGIDDPPSLLLTLVAQAERTGGAAALAMLRVLGAVAPDEVRPAATAAASRLVAGGLPDPAWAGGLGSPQFVSAYGYGDIFGHQETVGVTFRYGRKRHALLVLIDHVLGGGVKDVWPTDRVTRARSAHRAGAVMGGADFETYDASEAHALLSEALSKPPCPEQPDQIEDIDYYLDLLRRRVESLEAPAVPGPRRPGAGSSQARTVHRIKVTLRYSKPPIWRRLEVPSHVTLAKLHECLQTAFEWDGYHLWVFDTPRGTYGSPDPELGFRDAARVRLDEVAGHGGDRIRYTYDFGDNWEHEIVVESVGSAEPGVAYPRCLTGRRAAPPEDCGGVWGYADLLDVLADPAHEEHEDRLEWLGLESRDEFDPADFDADSVTELLEPLATALVPARP